MTWNAVTLWCEIGETFSELSPAPWGLLEDTRAAVRERWRIDARERRRLAGATPRPHVWIENKVPKPPKRKRRPLTPEEKRARVAAAQRRRRAELGDEHRRRDREYHRVWRERKRRAAELAAAIAAAAMVKPNRGCCSRCGQPAWYLVGSIGGGICSPCVHELGQRRAS